MSEYLNRVVTWIPSYTDKEPGGHASLETALEMFNDGTYKAHTDKIRSLDPKSEAYKKAKKEAPAFSMSGHFSFLGKDDEQGKRAADFLIEHSGVICFDADTGHPEETKQFLRSHPNVLAAGVSAGGVGSFAIVPISPIPRNEAEHRQAFSQVLLHMGVKLVDESQKGVARLRGITYDPDLYINPNAKPVNVTYRKPSAKKKQVYLNGNTDAAGEARTWLSRIDWRPGYNEWVKIIGGVLSKVGGDLDAAEMLLHEWRPEEEEGEYMVKLANPLTEVGFGSVIHYAQNKRFVPFDEGFSTDSSTLTGENSTAVEKPDYSIDHFKEDLAKLEGDAFTEKAYSLIDSFATLPKSEVNKVRLFLKKGGMTQRDIDDWQRGVREMIKETRTEPVRTQDPSKGLPVRLGEYFLETEHFAVNIGGQLYYYDGGVYRPNAKKYLKNRVYDTLVEWDLKQYWSEYRVNEVISFVKMKSPELWQEYPFEYSNHANILNGIINLETRDFEDHNPDFLSPIQFPINYDPKAEPVAWDKFFSEVYPQDVYQNNVHWQIACWALLSTNPGQNCVLKIGPGNDGKSRSLAAFKSLVGRQNTAHLSLQTIANNRFAATGLVGRALDICADLPSTHLNDSSLFKALTGDDTIEGEYKGGNFFPFENRCKLLFSANKIPSASDNTKGFLRRWVIIPMNQGAKIENPIPARVLDNMLANETELSGVLNKVLSVAKDVIKNGITQTESMKKAHSEFVLSIDHFGAWANKHLKEGEGNATHTSILKSYRSFCEAARVPIMKSEQVKQQILGRFKSAQWVKIPTTEGRDDNGYSNLKLNG